MGSWDMEPGDDIIGELFDKHKFEKNAAYKVAVPGFLFLPDIWEHVSYFQPIGEE